MHFRIPKNFRIRTRIYPRRYGNDYFYGYSSVNSNISEIDQNIENFGTQTNVNQSAIVNQLIDRR